MTSKHNVNKVPNDLRKWTLKMKISYIKEYLSERGYSVINTAHTVQWVGEKHANAGNVSIKFLQEMGELNFDKKIIQYFNLITDTSVERETATQREKNLRENIYYYSDKTRLFDKKTVSKKNASASKKKAKK